MMDKRYLKFCSDCVMLNHVFMLIFRKTINNYGQMGDILAHVLEGNMNVSF